MATCCSGRGWCTSAPDDCLCDDCIYYEWEEGIESTGSTGLEMKPSTGRFFVFIIYELIRPFWVFLPPGFVFYSDSIVLRPGVETCDGYFCTKTIRL